MSLLPHDTYVNAARPLWAAEGSGGGGGGGSTLTSPASITPTAGSATLDVALASGDAGNAAVNIVAGGDGGTASLNIQGGPNVYSMGCASSGLTFNLGVNPLQVGQGAALVYTPATGVLQLGDGLPAGNVLVNNLLTVGKPGQFANEAALGALTANTSKLTQTLAAGGNISIGSSVANPSGLIVSDIARSGVVNFVQVSGSPGNTSLFLSGYQASVGECVIAPDAPSGATLNLGSSSDVTSPLSAAISITDGATTINRLGGAPQTLLAQTNIPPGNVTTTLGTFPTPTGEGLYTIVGTSQSNPTQNSRDCQFSTIAYVNSGGRVQMGGATVADVGSVGGNDVLKISPTDGANTFNYAYNGANQITNFSVVAFKISGPIPGTI